MKRRHGDEPEPKRTPGSAEGERDRDRQPREQAPARTPGEAEGPREGTEESYREKGQ